MMAAIPGGCHTIRMKKTNGNPHPPHAAAAHGGPYEARAAVPPTPEAQRYSPGTREALTTALQSTGSTRAPSLGLSVPMERPLPR